MLVVDGRSRTGEIVDLVHLDIEREGHVVAHELEARMSVKMLDIALRAREQVVDTQDFVTLGEQAIDQMRAEESRAARHEDSFAAIIEAWHAFISFAVGAIARPVCTKPVTKPGANMYLT